MAKQLKDFLKYYIGTECWVQGQIETHPLKLTGISWDDQSHEWWCYFENTETGYAVLEDVKPILPKLEDMTEEEGKSLFGADRYWDIVCNEGNSRIFSAAEFYYLLSKSFDLFGLIEENLAIDQNTIKK